MLVRDYLKLQLADELDYLVTQKDIPLILISEKMIKLIKSQLNGLENREKFDGISRIYKKL